MVPKEFQNYLICLENVRKDKVAVCEGNMNKKDIEYLHKEFNVKKYSVNGKDIFTVSLKN